jgi:hypothetical protein
LSPTASQQRPTDLSGVPMQQAIRKIVKRESIKAVSVPIDFGDTVELIILPINNDTVPTESEQLMKLQEKTGFANTVLGNSTEDVWNDI